VSSTAQRAFLSQPVNKNFEVNKMLGRILEKLIKTVKLHNTINFNRFVRIHHQVIKIPVILGISCDLSETWMIDLLKHLLSQQEGAFLDVGVNLGQTLIKVKGIERQRKYIGFEPNSTCIFYTRELIKKNEFEDCTLVPVGLFLEDQVLLLESIYDSEVDSAASLIKNFRPDHTIYHAIPVPVFRFQNIAHTLNLGNTGIVKIDVEGAELEVIKSLYQLLESHRPIILLEVLPVYSDENLIRKERQEELEQIFRELNFLLFRVIKAGNKFMKLKKIENIGIHSDLNQCDYVVVPSELVVKIQDLV
jgi:FkbM family methyltransferase